MVTLTFDLVKIQDHRIYCPMLNLHHTEFCNNRSNTFTQGENQKTDKVIVTLTFDLGHIQGHVMNPHLKNLHCTKFGGNRPNICHTIGKRRKGQGH